MSDGRRRIKLALKAYGTSAMSSIFAIQAYYWTKYQLAGCFACAQQVWEPNPVVHTLEWIMMMAAIPGILIALWEEFD